MTSDIEVFESARHALQRLLDEYPELRELRSIDIQLKYLIELGKGLIGCDRLADVNIGLLAMREVEPRDPQVADVLYDAMERVRRLRNETGWPK